MSLTTCQYQWRLDGSWWLSTIKNFHTYIHTMRSDGVPSGWCTFSRSTFTCCTAMHIARGEGRDIARLPPLPPHLSPSWFHVHAPPLFCKPQLCPLSLEYFSKCSTEYMSSCTDCPVSDVWYSDTLHLFYITCSLRCQVLHKANQATTLPGDPFLLPGELQCFKCECMVTSPPYKHQLMNCVPQHAALCDTLSQPVPLLHP